MYSNCQSKIKKCNNLFKPLIKENIKYLKFKKIKNQNSKYCTHNKNNIKVDKINEWKYSNFLKMQLLNKEYPLLQLKRAFDFK